MTIDQEEFFEYTCESDCFAKKQDLEKTFAFDNAKVDGTGYLHRTRYYLNNILVAAIGVFSFSQRAIYHTRFYKVPL